MATNEDAEVEHVDAAGLHALGQVLDLDAPTPTLRSGVLAYILILVCGTCGFQGVLDPVRYCDNRVSLQVFRGQGWQSEIADDEHPTRWWRCSKCAEGEG